MNVNGNVGAHGGEPDGGHDPEPPSPWIVRFASLLAPGGSVLDVACGTGRHARWFEARGHRVTGIDRDAAALAACGATETLCCDLEDGDPAACWPVVDRRFAAVVVTRYLHRPVLPWIVRAVEPGGVLLYETFAAGNARFGRPRNPAFLLEPGELLDACRGLTIVAYEDGIVDDPSPASIQRICAVRDDGPPHEGVRDAGRARRHRLSPPGAPGLSKSAKIAHLPDRPGATPCDAPAAGPSIAARPPHRAP